jgi:hypothetical protein
MLSNVYYYTNFTFLRRKYTQKNVFEFNISVLSLHLFWQGYETKCSAVLDSCGILLLHRWATGAQRFEIG